MRTDRSASFDVSLRIAASAVVRHPLDLPAVMVTSAAAGEGKTTVCAGLARTLVAGGHRTALVDLSSRPQVHALVGGANEIGASDVLAGRTPLSEALQVLAVGDDELTFLSAGQHLDPALRRREDRLAELLRTVSQDADFVLVDTPALLPYAEALAVGGLCGGAILVAEARRRALPGLERAKDLLNRNRTPVVGVVLNTLG